MMLWSLLFYGILAIPLYVWGESFQWDFSLLSTFIIFPLLGLLAFNIMWIQVVVVAFEKHFKKNINLDHFFAKTGIAVLILFLAHPILALVANLTWNPFDLVLSEFAVFIILALIALVSFILFEITLRFKQELIQKARPWIENLSYIGVILVWVHALNIGSHTQHGLFGYIWWFYGVSVILMIALIFWRKWKEKMPLEDQE